ncbi:MULTISPECIES: ATP-binding protein [Kitasatospora]|uniref:Regulatory protein n=1 Tax=Kitasatospora griseola TaxID=2064 RepID=A0A0D0N5A5_KITGR|nr:MULTISPECIES: ATP-binding protein [Kitasatospora]KIQ63295.1 regulatory protein [Kitasatospora griseola]PJN24124.1 ATP-binding protein [Kitasatospora sp. CB02891]GGQ75695.1 ATP-binding protein [Kitasatospora griseola]
MQVLQVQLAVQADPAEVSRARRWVRARLQAGGLDPDSAVAETLVLVVSELVTNAVVHTGCPAVLRLLMPAGPDAPPGLRVEVADASCAAPAPRHAGADAEATNGRGLELVELLCERWGWYPDGSGKRVWCEIGPAVAVCERAAQPVASAR